MWSSPTKTARRGVETKFFFLSYCTNNFTLRITVPFLLPSFPPPLLPSSRLVSSPLLSFPRPPFLLCLPSSSAFLPPLPLHFESTALSSFILVNSLPPCSSHTTQRNSEREK